LHPVTVARIRQIYGNHVVLWEASVMATYEQIQQRIRQTEGYVVKTCWIADVKAAHGLTTRIAPNRLNAQKRKHPCPPEKRSVIERALRHFGMMK
jgi:hypothetical protein